MRQTIEFSVLVMAASLVGAMIAAIYFRARRGSLLNIPTILTINYAVVYLLSGVVHLTSPWNANRGYYDATIASPQTVALAAITSSFGLVAVVVGARISRSKSAPAHSSLVMTRPERAYAVVFIIAMVPIGLFALYQMQGYADMMGQSRIISLPEGLARFSILSQWLVWVISLLALLIARGRTSAITTAVILAISILGILSVLSWSGGRSVAILLSMPLILVLWPRTARLSWLLLPVAAALLFQYLSALSTTRSGTAIDTVSQLLQWLDWEWGRWSMLAFSLSAAESGGLLGGQTFIASVLSATEGIWSVVFPTEIPFPTMSEYAGSALLGRPDLTYIVPGLGSELIANFGVVGYITGFFLIGWLAAKIDDRIRVARSLLERFFWAYAGSLVVFRLIVTDVGGVVSYLSLIGAPVLAGLVVTRLARKSSAGEHNESGETELSGSFTHQSAIHMRGAQSPGA